MAIVVSGDLSVATNGSITATGRGFPSGTGPGAGGSFIGGTHGGMAYSNTNAVYGSQTASTTLGSGGGANGGGAIKLEVGGNLIVNGAIQANGNSGGFTLSVGGGGRIAIADTVTYAFTGNIRAGCIIGVPSGTVYLPAAARADFTILTNQTIIIGGAGEYTFGNLTINGGGTLTMGGAFTGEGTNCTVTVINLTVHTNGSITATGWGFPRDTGPGKGGTFIGGTHGGMGKDNTNAVYGSQTAPTSAGSGGLVNGGGAIRLDVKHNLIVNGAIQANGGDWEYGSAAGGSVWIQTYDLAGSGLISANGGVSAYGGGGGRIAIYYRTKTFAGLPAQGLYTNQQTISSTVTVKGGYNTSADGPEDGSIYIKRVQTGTIVSIF